MSRSQIRRQKVSGLCGDRRNGAKPTAAAANDALRSTSQSAHGIFPRAQFGAGLCFRPCLSSLLRSLAWAIPGDSVDGLTRWLGARTWRGPKPASSFSVYDRRRQHTRAQ
jgi:hypothetical protein